MKFSVSHSGEVRSLSVSASLFNIYGSVWYLSDLEIDMLKGIYQFGILDLRRVTCQAMVIFQADCRQKRD